MYNVCNSTTFLQYILHKIQKFLVLIRNAEVCGDGECKYVNYSYEDSSYDDGSYEDGSYEDGSYEDGSYKDGSYEEPRKIRNKRTTPPRIQ